MAALDPKNLNNCKMGLRQVALYQFSIGTIFISVFSTLSLCIGVFSPAWIVVYRKSVRISEGPWYTRACPDEEGDCILSTREAIYGIHSDGRGDSRKIMFFFTKKSYFRSVCVRACVRVCVCCGWGLAMGRGGGEAIRKDSKQLSQLQRDKLAAKETRDQSKRFAIRLRDYKTFCCSTQLSMKFIMHINVLMVTIFGIFSSE